MFNTRCVSIIPLMAARQGAKHISKCEERCLKSFFYPEGSNFEKMF